MHTTETTPTLDIPPYATFCEEELVAADRMEALYNANRRTVLALGWSNAHHPVSGLGDDSLRRLAKQYERDIEDLNDEEAEQTTKGNRRRRISRRRAIEIKLRDVERTQEFRAALAESWLAAEDGTHCYSAFQGRGGLAAVRDGGATPPSYDLAVTLDWEHWKRGLPHVLAWGESR